MVRARLNCSGGPLAGARGTGDAGRRRLRSGARLLPQPTAAREAWPVPFSPSLPANLPDSSWNARRQGPPVSLQSQERARELDENRLGRHLTLNCQWEAPYHPSHSRDSSRRRRSFRSPRAWPCACALPRRPGAAQRSVSFPLFLDRATPPNPSHPVVAEEHLAVPREAPLGPGRGCTRMWSRSRPAGTRWRGGARRRARGLREAGPGAPAPAARRPLAPLPIAEPAPGRPGPSERPGAAEGRRLAWPPAALAAAPGRASPGPPRSRPGESEVCWRPSL
ncbi:uncharacterized protein LOC115065523 [Mus pahari]|uniref:uncharacterized protein LOC115065523 n=1 Tax=Mus pahari TaxID=10093 RepID=UPI001114F64E|nr:uncharacterized protein LOC115065523 [Mus pahari]